MKGLAFLRMWLPHAMRGQIGLVALACVLSLGTAVCSLGASLLPWILHESRAHLLTPIGLFLLFRATFSVAQDRISESLACKAMLHLSEKICTGFVHASYEVRHSLGLAEFMFLFNQTATKLELLAREIPKALFSSLPTLLILLGAGFYLNPVLMVGLLGLMVALAPLVVVLSREKARSGKKVLELNIRSQKRLRELGAAVGPLWGLGSADALRQTLVTQEIYLKARKENYHKLNGLVYAGEFALAFGLLGVDRLGWQGLGLVQILSGFMGFHYGIYALRQISRIPIFLKEIEDQAEKLDQLYHSEAPNGTWEGPVRHLALSGVSYHYPGSNEGAVRDLNLGLSPGRLVIIMGKNGSGKSTLLRLLSAKLHPQKGDLRVGGAKIDPVQAKTLGPKMAYLPQDLSLPETRIGDFLEDLTEGKAMMLARNMGLMPLLARQGNADLPALSRGELQKVVVLRVLFQPAEAWFLDEWDTAMDEDSKKAVLDHLRKVAQDKIVVCVTHDEGMPGSEDLVLHMREGRLMEGSGNVS